MTGAFLSTIIATGNFGTAFQAGLIGLAVGFVAGGLVKVPLINGVFGTVGSAIKPVFLFVSDAGKIATNFVSQLVTKAVSDALTTVLDKVVSLRSGRRSLWLAVFPRIGLVCPDRLCRR